MHRLPGIPDHLSCQRRDEKRAPAHLHSYREPGTVALSTYTFTLTLSDARQYRPRQGRTATIPDRPGEMFRSRSASRPGVYSAPVAVALPYRVGQTAYRGKIRGSEATYHENHAH